MKLIEQLERVSRRDLKRVGGKAASLGEMLTAGINVPPGFVITTEGFRAGMSGKLEGEILRAFNKLGVKRVAVRSSAVAEDSKTASWAGQLETYLNVTVDGLIEAVEQCWQSINSEHATEYARQNNIPAADRAVGVVVQAMLDSEVAGVMFTANPITSNRDELMIEAVYGLGELLVQGLVTPESFVINKQSAAVTQHSPSRQLKMLTWQDGQNAEVPLSAAQADKTTLSPQNIQELVAAAQTIEAHYGSPQDIEWAITADQLYIVQSRPITTLSDATIGDEQLPPVKLSKLFSREKGIWYAYLWDECDRKAYATYLDYTVQNSAFIRESVKLSIWFDLTEREVIDTKLTALVNGDKDFIPKLFHDLEQEWQWLQPYLDKQQQLADFQELRDYYTHLTAWWVPMTIIFNITALNLPAEAIKEALKGREQAESYSDVMDVVWNEFWNGQSQHQKLANLFTPEEAFTANALSPALLRDVAKRSKGVGLLNSTLYQLADFDMALKTCGIELEQAVISTGISEVTGNVAYKGDAIIKGRVRLILRKKDIALLKEGEILVTDMTSPDFLPAIRKAAALVTDEGGLTSHAAIAAREIKTPAVIGTRSATQLFKNGDIIKVDTERGIVSSHASLAGRQLKKTTIVGTRTATRVLKNGDMVEVDGTNGTVKIIE